MPIRTRTKTGRGMLQWSQRAKDLLYRLVPQQVGQEAKILNILKEGDHHTHITFGGHNSGMQVGVSHGPINWTG